MLTDNDLKNLYSKAKICIIPLKESSQPSGQSVALQAMSLGLPVIISNTEGFWDKSKFENGKNIIFPKSNNLNEWIETISEYYSTESKLLDISNNAKKTVEENFDLTTFNKRLTDVY